MQLRSVLDTSTAGGESSFSRCSSGHVGAIVLFGFNFPTSTGTLVITTAESGIGPAGKTIFDQAIDTANGASRREMIFDSPLSLEGYGWFSYTLTASAGSVHAQVYEWVR